MVRDYIQLHANAESGSDQMMLETIYVAKPGSSGKGDNVNLTWRTPRHRPHGCTDARMHGCTDARMHGCTDFEKLLPAISNTIQIEEKLTASTGKPAIE